MLWVAAGVFWLALIGLGLRIGYVRARTLGRIEGREEERASVTRLGERRDRAMGLGGRSGGDGPRAA